MHITKQNRKIFSTNRSINYTDVDLLIQYLTEQGKILPKRITGLSAKEQKRITKSIKRARILSLLPFVHK